MAENAPPVSSVESMICMSRPKGRMPSPPPGFTMRGCSFLPDSDPLDSAMANSQSCAGGSLARRPNRCQDQIKTDNHAKNRIGPGKPGNENAGRHDRCEHL